MQLNIRELEIIFIKYTLTLTKANIFHVMYIFKHKKPYWFPHLSAAFLLALNFDPEDGSDMFL
jgi:hypothetical protein